MYKRKIAAILSLTYCGLGQIYNGEFMKGIVFIMVYTLLIFFTFFTKPWSLINSFSLPILILMWVTGMLDAYLYSENPGEDESSLQLARPILVGVAIFLSFITIGLAMILQNPEHERAGISPELASSNAALIFGSSSPNHIDTIVSEGATGKQPEQQYSETPALEVVEPESPLIQSNIEKDTNSETYIRIQVGAFSTQIEAEKLADSLREKGYSVNFLSPVSSDTQKLYKVRVGKFQSEDNALRIAQILSKNEGIPAILVYVTE